jgi:iron complex transport system substrate-binding protein
VFRSILVVLAATAFLVVAGAAPSSTRAVPHRIVSLSPTATEDLFAIGAGPQVVAVDSASDYPKNAPRTKLSGLTPNAEAIVGLHPDLVVIQFDPNKLVPALAKAKIRTLVEPSAPTLAAAYGQLEQLGKITGHLSEAKALVARLKARIAALVAGAPKPSAPLTVYDELSPDYYSASSKTFIGQVLGLFGLKNIADAADSSGSGYPQLSGEYIVGANPDLIVLLDSVCCGQTRATVAARPGWSGLTAVKRGAIVRVDDSVASRWGPRVVLFVKALASAMKTLNG